MAGSSFNNKIHQTGRFRSVEQPITAASATIYPGMLLEQVATGFQCHGTTIGTAAGWAERIIAQEDALQGGTIYGFEALGASTYTGYTYIGLGGTNANPAPDTVMAYYEAPGSVTLLLLQGNHNYTVGMGLISAGNGYFKPTTASTDKILAVVTAAINLSATSAGTGLTQARIV